MSRVAFNIGLAYMRWRRKDEAMIWFERSMTLSGGTFEKAQRYVGGPITTEDIGELIEEESIEQMPTAVVEAADDLFEEETFGSARKP